jgi:NitT/TauT family transport system substrate-binding protein
VIPLLLFLQATLTIVVGGPPTSTEYLPLRLAEAEGYFRTAGLQVALQAARSESQAAEALARGQADIAATSLDAALRHGAVGGRPPRLVFGLTAAPPVTLLVSAVHRQAIARIEDLAGRTVAASTPGAPAHSLLLALLDRHELLASRLSLLSLGERAVAAGLETGEVHAALLPDPWASRLLAEGKATLLADFRRAEDAARWLGGPTVQAALFVGPGTRLTATELRAVATALLQGILRVQGAPPEDLLASLPERAVGLVEDFRTRLAGSRGIYLPGGWVSPERLELSLDLIRARAPLPKTLALPRRPADLLLLAPLKAVLDSR